MKNIKSITLLLLTISFLFINCNQDEITPNEDSLNLDFSNLKFNFDSTFMSNDFAVGYSNPKQLNELITKFNNYKTIKNNENDEELLGFNFSINLNSTKVTPITSNSMNTFSRSTPSAAGCAKGFTSLGVCYSASCVTNKVSSFFDKNKDDLKDGATISVNLVNHMGGKRVCGKVSLNNQQ